MGFDDRKGNLEIKVRVQHKNGTPSAPGMSSRVTARHKTD